MGEVAGQFVLKSELFFLEAVEKVFVGVGSMLFFLDQGVKSAACFDSSSSTIALSIGAVPFSKQCHQRVINHESCILS